MSVVVCAGKLTYPIKYSSDKLDISGVSYTERLTDYLKYNSHIEKVIFIETIDNVFQEEDVSGFTGEISVLTNKADKYDATNTTSPRLTPETLGLIGSVKELEGLRVSDIQWEIMTS